MTADIKFEGFKKVKPSSFTWERSVDNFSDHAKIVLPAVCRLVGKGATTILSNIGTNADVIPTGQAIPEGAKVEITAGYDGENVTRFKGFVKRVNYKVPVEFECEGYAYQLRKVMFNLTYLNTTVKAILQELIIGTDIKLSAHIPHIPIPKVWFKNYTGVQVLEYLKEKCLLTVYFTFDTLYVGLRAGEAKGVVKHRLNWNVIKDDALLFNADKEFANVNIVVDVRKQDGTHNRQKAHQGKPGNEIHVKLFLINDAAVRKQIADEEKAKVNNKGYTGSLTAFLHPYVEPGMSSDIQDKTYQERNGRHFVESVRGSFDQSGGRQKIGIGFSL